jgi:hypothetical protein
MDDTGEQWLATAPPFSSTGLKEQTE